jgi:flavin reductase (DIM6/NTAB) family NADH-FMN oxidoreductase RutF
MKMQAFDPAVLGPEGNYKLLSGAVVPRPIAFVSTLDAAGVRNVAPYSFFTVASANPPVLCFCPSVRKPQPGLAAHKDTLANVRATGEFVVNIVSEDYVAKMNAAAAQVSPEVDEFTLAGLSAVPSERVGAPGVGESRVRMECRLLQVVEVSDLPMGGSLVLGQVVRFHVADEVLREGLHIDAGSLDAVGRMAGSTYARTTDRFELERPK